MTVYINVPCPWVDWYSSMQHICPMIPDISSGSLREVLGDCIQLHCSCEILTIMRDNLADRCEDGDDAMQIATSLSLPAIRDRPWQIQPCCAKSGEGLKEGMEWLIKQVQ